MRRSFRLQLAIRYTIAMGVSAAVISLISVMTLRSVLDRELDASILSVASIQAASLTDAPAGAMHFHEWELSAEEAVSVQDLVRYAQVWEVAGESLLRSQFMTEDLPTDPDMLRNAASGELLWQEGSYQTIPIRTLYYPLARLGPAHQDHVLQVAAPLVGRNELVARVAQFFTALWVLVTVGSFGGGWWLGGRAVRPVHDVIDQAEAIGSGSLDRGITAHADSMEYHRLVSVLNTMLGRIRDGFDSQKRFIADASHELRSPLTAMRGELELALRRDRPSEEYRRVIASTLEETERLTRITGDLLTLARSDAGALSPRRDSVDVVELAEDVVRRLAPRSSEKGVDVQINAPERPHQRVDAGLLTQMIWNLTENAIKFSPTSGAVGLSLEERDGALIVTVTDQGPGLGDMPERIFERFYRADESRTHDAETPGTGLGLAIVKAGAEAHGGSAKAFNRTEGGARIVVTLPRESDNA